MAIKNQTLISIFFFILFILLLHGVVCQPNIGRFPVETYNNLPIKIFHPTIEYKIYVTSYFHISPVMFCEEKKFLVNLWYESGFVENLQALFLFLSIIFIFRAQKKYNKNLFIKIFLILNLIGLIYYFGEEISWGQHFLKWETFEFFSKYNNQNETNIHNISNIFDQLPRSLITVWCSLSVPLILIIKKYFILNKDLIKIICPDKILIIISVTSLLFILPDLVIDKLNLHPGWTDNNGFRLNNYAYFYDMFTFNFVRLSELQEFIFSFYFLIYSNSFQSDKI